MLSRVLAAGIFATLRASGAALAAPSATPEAQFVDSGFRSLWGHFAADA